MLKALTGVAAAIFGRKSAKERSVSPEEKPPECDGRLKRLAGLVSRYREKCGCHGDQYGSWGPCELCKEPLVGDPWVPRPSRNYLVTQTAPGKFRCEVMIQDGWERWDETSLESAKESVIRAAKFLNGTTLDDGNISIVVVGGK